MRERRPVGRWGGGFDPSRAPGARVAIIITTVILAALTLGACRALFYDHALPPFAGRVERVIELDDVFGGADPYHFRLFAARMVRNGSEQDAIAVIGPSEGGRTAALTFDGRSLERYDATERHYVTQVLTRPDGSLAFIDSYDTSWHVGPLDDSLEEPRLFEIRPFDADGPGLEIFEPITLAEFDTGEWGTTERVVPLGPPVADTSRVEIVSPAAAPRPVAFDPDSAVEYFENSMVSLTLEVFLDDGTEAFIVTRFPAELLHALFQEGTDLPGDDDDFLSSVSSVIVEYDYLAGKRDWEQRVFFTRSAVLIATDDGRMVRVPFPDGPGEMVRVGYSDESAVTAEAPIHNAEDYLFEVSREGTRLHMFAPRRRRLYSVRPFW